MTSIPSTRRGRAPNRRGARGAGRRAATGRGLTKKPWTGEPHPYPTTNLCRSGRRGSPVLGDHVVFHADIFSDTGLCVGAFSYRHINFCWRLRLTSPWARHTKTDQNVSRCYRVFSPSPCSVHTRKDGALPPASSREPRAGMLADCDAGLASCAVARQWRVSWMWGDRLKQRQRNTGKIGLRRSE